MKRKQVVIVIASIIAVMGCNKPVAFQGDSTFAVSGNPPAPPPEPPPRVEVKADRIAIHEKVQFEYNQATIMAVSFGLLDEVASVILKNPQIKKIQIEGHASSEGNARHNQKLSQERAQAVMAYLTKQGVAKEALVARGFGIDKPIGDNATDEGREQNRRVEFNILEQDVAQVETDPDTVERMVEK